MRIKTVQPMMLGVDHGPSRKGELMGKGKGEITHIVLVPEERSRSR